MPIHEISQRIFQWWQEIFQMEMSHWRTRSIPNEDLSLKNMKSFENMEYLKRECFIEHIKCLSWRMFRWIYEEYFNEYIEYVKSLRRRKCHWRTWNFCVQWNILIWDISYYYWNIFHLRFRVTVKNSLSNKIF